MHKIILIIILAFIGTANAKSKVQAPVIEPPTVLVYNVNEGQTILGDNLDVVRPVASITKLMTAIVALDHFSLTDNISIGKKQTVTVESLLTRLLVRSDNHASELLAKAYPGGRENFLSAMNVKAQTLGLSNTKFDDPSGLIMTNTATAYDMAKLVAVAGNYSFISKVSSQPEITETVSTKKKTKTMTIANTNRSILVDFKNVLVSKTGFTSRAGRCLAMLVERQGVKYAIIILGEPTKQARESAARKLLALTV